MVQLSDEITNDQIHTVQERINKLFKKKLKYYILKFQ
jgi:hypothetical protein